MSFWFKSRKTPSTSNSTGTSSNSGTNPYTAKADVMKRIARRVAVESANWMREGDWNVYRSGNTWTLEVKVTVNNEDVYCGVPSGSPRRRRHIPAIPFSAFGMDSLLSAIPEGFRNSKFSRERNLKQFLEALKSHLDLYFPQAIEEKFKDVSPEIRLSTSVNFGKEYDTAYYEYIDCIDLTLTYSYPKENKTLNSWR